MSDSSLQSWQTALNPSLTRRLLRPVVQPGGGATRLAHQIFGRSLDLYDRLPLVDHLRQRYAATIDEQANAPAIVYAQPVPLNSEPTSAAPSSTSRQPQLSVSQPTVIQAKFTNSTAATAAQASLSADLPGSDLGSLSPSMPIHNAATSSRASEPLGDGANRALGAAEGRTLPIVQPSMLISPRMPDWERVASQGFRDATEPGSDAVSIQRSVAPSAIKLVSASPIKAFQKNSKADLSSDQLVFSRRANRLDQADRWSDPQPQLANSMPLVRPSNPPTLQLSNSLNPPMVAARSFGVWQSQSQIPESPAAQRSSQPALPHRPDAETIQKNHSQALAQRSSALSHDTVSQPAAAQPASPAPIPEQPRPPDVPPKVDVAALTLQVERRLLRRMAVERERRGGR
ncbi:hypothetical protein [Myxacorys almedinensis]|uniref:Uncharacterized protein n=1 Tax=Myxacorys almedinensis A TaxID=2690445 RepID=A0A8J7Z295_9CYAN|nr:hypothetical protein [Myxacorys almedinensis]NDJ16466.1 hypothetical protein [Myxacorys almedinensis A]